jgi:hypothetical protein
MQITKEFIRSLDPCVDGFKWWCEKYGESVELSDFVEAADEKWEYVRWLSVRCLTHKSQVLFAVWCAERVKHCGPSDASQKAIDAAKKWVEDPSEENAAAAYSAYSANYAAYADYAAASAEAAYFSATAAYSASAAAYTAAYTAYAANAAAYAANYVAYSAAYVAYATDAAEAAAYAAEAAAYAAYAAAYAADKEFKKEAMSYLLTLEIIECK